MAAFSYPAIPAFRDFSAIVDDVHYHPIPDDWAVVVSDVAGSTAAIEEGRYRDVNVLGAATIATALRTVDQEFPFVFGGDGASMVVPQAAVEPLVTALLDLADQAHERFHLTLRIGSVPVADIRARGLGIEVARHQLPSGSCLAVLRGGGLSAAEEMIKEDQDRYQFAPRPASPGASFSGLSCRWQPIPSAHGRVVSLLVEARLGRVDDGGPVYRRFLTFLEGLFDGQLDTANPVAVDQMSYRTFLQCVRDERRYHRHWYAPRLWARLAEIAAARLIFRWRVPPLVFNPDQYRRSMRTHSDHRKFDDMLRMVLDCSAQQLADLRDYLEQAYQAGELYYGLHESDSSLMTCLVQGMADGEHLHFIDGSDGGYAMAAKQLKEQFQASLTRPGRRALNLGACNG